MSNNIGKRYRSDETLHDVGHGELSRSGDHYAMATGMERVRDSRINRDGLPAGTPAPDFRLPQVGGGELSLYDYRGEQLLLVFSDPDCGPCSQLLPELERLHRSSQDLQILMVARGDAETNHAKVSEYGLTFPVAMQRKWEISKKYGIFATPVGYLIDEQGIIEADVAIGDGAILALAMGEEGIMHEQMQARLEVLKQEFETGETELEKVEKQRAYLRETLLRIGGAIQVLEELLAGGPSVEQRNGVGLGASEPKATDSLPGGVRTEEVDQAT